MRKFTTRVSIPCTSEQFEADLRGPLEAMGYKVDKLNYWDRNTILINCFRGLGIVSNVSSSSCSQPLTTYNPTLFLALAAMSEGDEFFAGEWGHAKGLHGLSKVLSVEGIYYTAENQGEVYPGIDRPLFRKASKEEIIAHFAAAIEPVYTSEDLPDPVRASESMQFQIAEPVQAERHNSGKTAWTLADFDTLEGMVKVLEVGAVKYSPDNWKKGLPTTEIVESMLRHLTAYLRGEDNDPETGLHHADHIQCNAMFLAYMCRYRKDFDSRSIDKVKL